MLIETYTVEFLEPRRVRLAWTGTANHYAWVFVNGEAREGVQNFGAVTARELVLRVPDRFAIEIHEQDPASVSPTPTRASLARFPVLFWTPVANARRYLIYRKPDAVATERLQQVVRHQDAVDYYQQASVRDAQSYRGGTWNRYRVAVLDQHGRESDTTLIPHFVRELPATPAGVSITGTSPNLTLTLT